MIEWLQNRRKFLVIVLGVTVFAFVGAGFVGWGSYSYGSSASAVATVGKEKITLDQYQQAYSSIYGFYSQYYGENMNENIQRELQQVALNNLINEALILNYAKELGILATKEEVATAILSMETFQKDGKFEKSIYLETLRNMQRTVKDFEEGIRKQIVVDKLLYLFDMPATSSEKNAIASSAYMADKVEYRVINAPKNIAVSADEVKAHYEKNRFDYMDEPSYDINYIKISIENMGITNSEVEEFYNKNRAMFLSDQGEMLNLDQVKDEATKEAKLANARRDALKAKIALRDGKDEAIRLQNISRNSTTLPAEVFDAIEATSKKDILDPIKSDEGYFVVEVTNRHTLQPMALDQVAGAIRDQLADEKKEELIKADATKQLPSFKGKTTAFFTSQDMPEIAGLRDYEIEEFVSELFRNSSKDGFVVFADKAVLYRILEQKLFDDSKVSVADEMLSSTTGQAKSSQLQKGLLDTLQQRYKTTLY